MKKIKPAAAASTCHQSEAEAESVLTPDIINELLVARPAALPDNRKLIGAELRHKMGLLKPLEDRGWRDDLCRCHIAIRRALDQAWWTTECALTWFREGELVPDAVLPHLDRLAGAKGYGGVRSGGLVSAAQSALTPAILGELQSAYLNIRQEPGSTIVGHFAASCAHEAAMHFARGVRNVYLDAVHSKDREKQLETFYRRMADAPAIDHAALVASMEMETAEASAKATSQVQYAMNGQSKRISRQETADRLKKSAAEISRLLLTANGPFAGASIKDPISRQWAIDEQRVNELVAKGFGKRRNRKAKAPAQPTNSERPQPEYKTYECKCGHTTESFKPPRCTECHRGVMKEKKRVAR